MERWQSPKSRPQILMFLSAEPLTSVVLSSEISMERTCQIEQEKKVSKAGKRKTTQTSMAIVCATIVWMLRSKNAQVCIVSSHSPAACVHIETGRTWECPQKTPWWLHPAGRPPEACHHDCSKKRTRGIVSTMDSITEAMTRTYGQRKAELSTRALVSLLLAFTCAVATTTRRISPSSQIHCDLGN